MGEIRKGVEMLVPSAKKEKLLLFLETEVPNWFEDRIVSVDLKVSDKWGRLYFKSFPINLINPWDEI